MTFATGLTGAVAGHHYEQPGSLAGVLEIDGERVAIAGRGMRDHSWGVRDWQAVPYWRWFGIVVDPDNFLMLNNVGTAGGGETVGRTGDARRGRLRGGRAARPSRSSTPSSAASGASSPGPPTQLGREAVLEGEAISVAPLRQRRDGRLTVVNEGLTRLRWDGHEGRGISEYLFQREGEAGASCNGDAHDPRPPSEAHQNRCDRCSPPCVESLAGRAKAVSGPSSAGPTAGLPPTQPENVRARPPGGAQRICARLR